MAISQITSNSIAAGAVSASDLADGLATQWTTSGANISYSTGNVGIGVTSPTERLDVVVPANTDGYSRVNTTSSNVAVGAKYSLAGTEYLRLYADSTQVGIFGIQSVPLTFKTANTERMRIDSSGALGFSGANYGTSGQALVSNGSGAAPSWQSIGASTDYGAIGTYVAAFGAINTGYNAGSTISGSALCYNPIQSVGGFNYHPGSSSGSGQNMFCQSGSTMTSLGLTGTWRAMTKGGSTAPTGGQAQFHLWVRVS